MGQFMQRLTQLEGHADPREPLKRVLTVRLTGIYNSIRCRQGLRRAMVICNNNIQPGRRRRYFLHTADPTVHRDHQCHAILIQRLQRFIVQAVAFALTPGDISLHIGPVLRQIQIQ